MADQTSSSLTIAAPPHDILTVIADLHAYPEWNGEIKSVEVPTPRRTAGRARPASASPAAG